MCRRARRRRRGPCRSDRTGRPTRAALRAPRPGPGQGPARLPRLHARVPPPPGGGRRLRRCAGSPRPSIWPGAFRTEEGRALVAGTAAHSMLPLTAPLSGVFPRLFTALAHRYGWPVVEGGSAAIVDALVAELTAPAGGWRRAASSSDWTSCRRRRAVVLDVTPRQLLEMAGDALPAALPPGPRPLPLRARRVQGRLGPAAGRSRGSAEGCRQTVTVHVGGTFEEIARQRGGRRTPAGTRSARTAWSPSPAWSTRRGHRKAGTRCGPTATSPTDRRWT